MKVPKVITGGHFNQSPHGRGILEGNLKAINLFIRNECVVEESCEFWLLHGLHGGIVDLAGSFSKLIPPPTHL
jgi:hypothetical protein